MTRRTRLLRLACVALAAVTVAVSLGACATPSDTSARPRARHTKSARPATPTRTPKARPTHTAQPSKSPSQAPKQGVRPKGPVSGGWHVYDVVDGDTVKVDKGPRELTLRLIGIDTPETVDPFKPVECFGPQASAFAQRTLAGRRVLLEFDPSQGRLDRYGRTLAYVWVVRPDGTRWSYDLAAVRQGYAFEYTYDTAYLWQREYQQAQARAKADDRGLWSPKTCNGNPYHGV